MYFRIVYFLIAEMNMSMKIRFRFPILCVLFAIFNGNVALTWTDDEVKNIDNKQTNKWNNQNSKDKTIT